MFSLLDYCRFQKKLQVFTVCLFQYFTLNLRIGPQWRFSGLRVSKVHVWPRILPDLPVYLPGVRASFSPQTNGNWTVIQQNNKTVAKQ